MLNMFQPRFGAVLEYRGLKTKRPWETGPSVVNGFMDSLVGFSIIYFLNYQLNLLLQVSRITNDVSVYLFNFIFAVVTTCSRTLLPLLLYDIHTWLIW